MARDSNTQDNFLLLFSQEFGFNLNAATALYDMQMLKDAKTLSELDNVTIANICKVVSKDTSQSVAKIATTFGSDTSTGPQERLGGPEDHL
jgi:hypothetical protein